LGKVGIREKLKLRAMSKVLSRLLELGMLDMNKMKDALTVRKVSRFFI
jgi:hypothetical protein